MVEPPPPPPSSTEDVPVVIVGVDVDEDPGGGGPHEDGFGTYGTLNVDMVDILILWLTVVVVDLCRSSRPV